MERRQIENRHEHQEAPEHRVERELDRRVDPPRTAPYADQQVHRHEHHFPKDVEEDEVEGEERAEHAGLEHEHEDHVLLHPSVNVTEGREHDEHRQERRQEHEEQAHAVDAEQVLNPEIGQPLVALDHLEIGA